MSNNNPWFLITHEEIRTIRESLANMDHELPVRCRESGRAITGILDTVECRQQ